MFKKNHKMRMQDNAGITNRKGKVFLLACAQYEHQSLNPILYIIAHILSGLQTATI